METKFLFTIALIAITATSHAITVNTIEDQFDTPSGAEISLREAVRDLGSAGGTITIDVIEADLPLWIRNPDINRNIALPLFLDAGLNLGFEGSPLTIQSADEDRPIQIAFSDVSTETNYMLETSRDLTLTDINLEGDGSCQIGLRQLGGSSVVTLVDSAIKGFETGLQINSGGGSLDADYTSFTENELAIDFINFTDASIVGCLFAFNQQALNFQSIASDGNLGVITSTFAENGIAGQAVVYLADGIGMGRFVHNSFVDNTGFALSSPSSTDAKGNIFTRNYSGLVPEQRTSVEFGVLVGGRGINSLGNNLTDHDPGIFSDIFDGPGDLETTDTKISRLGDFGGKVYSCIPYYLSPAIDSGGSQFPTVGIDTRGFGRNADNPFSSRTNIIDIGAVEINPHGTLVVDSGLPSGPGSLAQVLSQATEETNHIVFDINGSQNIQLPGTVRFGSGNNLNIDSSPFTGSFFQATADLEPAFFAIGTVLFGVPTTSVSFSYFNFDTIYPD